MVANESGIFSIVGMGSSGRRGPTPPAGAVAPWLRHCWRPPGQYGGASDNKTGGGGATYTKGVLAALMVGTALEWFDFSIVSQLDGPLSKSFFPQTARPEVKALAFWLVSATALCGAACETAKAYAAAFASTHPSRLTHNLCTLLLLP